MMKCLLTLSLLSTYLVNACEQGEVYPDNTFPEVRITTNMGSILIELDRNRSPITVNNFLKYVKSGAYVGTVFHRVEKDFVIQGGGYDKKFKSIESCGKIFNESGNGLKNTKGSIAMARYDDQNSATSQFFFNLSDNPSLDPNAKNWGYTVFGEVQEGMDVLEKMAKVRIGYSNKLNAETVPIEPIYITNVKIEN